MKRRFKTGFRVAGVVGGLVLFLMIVLRDVMVHETEHQEISDKSTAQQQWTLNTVPKSPAPMPGRSEQPREESFSSPIIARSVSLSIVAKDFRRSRIAIEEVLKRHHGYAADLSVNSEQNHAQALQASLRIPSEELGESLTELKSLGTVESESQKGEEVTQQHSDLVARLKNSRETEQRLQIILQQRTGKMSDVLEVEQEISRVRGEIERIEAHQKELEHRVEFATVDLRIGEEHRVQLGTSSLGNRVRNAFVTGFQRAADTIVGLLLFCISYGPIIILWLLILVLPGRFFWKRIARILASENLVAEKS